MIHTPIDFLLSACLLGVVAAPLFSQLAEASRRTLGIATPGVSASDFRLLPLITVSVLWILNLAIRTVRLNRSSMYERHASASLLNTDELRGTFLVSFALVGLAVLLSVAGYPMYVLPAALAGVISSRYLFFISVVPLNMALTFVRSVRA
jgi:hypothetical protein